jgi:hypothetical protein
MLIKLVSQYEGEECDDGNLINRDGKKNKWFQDETRGDPVPDF